MTFSIIQKSQIEGALRLDAEYYQPEYLELEEKLNSIKTETIYDISKSVVNFGAYSLCNFIHWEEQGVPYLNVQDIKDGYIDFDNTKFISEKVDKILKKSKVAEGQIIMTMAGTIGNVAVAHKIPLKVNSNQAIAKITLKKEISPYYIVAFFNSYYGKTQILREIVSSVQPNIFLFQIKNFKVPIVSVKKQKEIEDIYKQGLGEFEKSKSFYTQADNFLLEELGLKDFNPEENLSSVVNLSEVKSANRIDAEYFQPKYEKLKLKIKKYGAKKLGDILENVSAKFNPKQDEKYRYVELSNINSSIGVIDGFSEIIGREAPSRAKRILRKGDVIVSSVEGSLEKVAIVGKEQNNYLASTGFFQFKSKEILPEVLLILAKSLVFQMQLEKQCTGTILTAVSKGTIGNTLIPILSKSTQTKIADLVQKSHEARKKARELLEEAKQKVEELIEKGNKNND